MIYLFWTGGFDSTFRLCQALIKEKQAVQPIYINDRQLDNTHSERIKRRNTEQEQKSMQKIRHMILKHFPFVKENNLLQKLVSIPNCDYDNIIRKSMLTLHKKKYIRRPQCQYGGMAQVCKNLNLNIEVCAEIGGFFEQKLKNKMKCAYGRCRFDYDSNHALHIFNRFELPLILYTKKDMISESIADGYDIILKQTWSCWYPVNNQPCGKCDMCRHRPIFPVMKNNIYTFFRIPHYIEIIVSLVTLLYIVIYVRI